MSVEIFQLQLFILIRYFSNLQADTQLQMEKRSFHQTALDYVVKLQEVNEKKKFEFVETVSVLRWLTTVFVLCDSLICARAAQSTRKHHA